ncbi:tautomerase family protein [Heyndrickxia acidicola]|uniref:Tautomerase family protein n=1 Tax=Heyndrickxia acidicola TaxID=209389 RepID=A0ABU6MI01_9BACI|nr:tautomerase family protein [Heyndrickxia acidicola]MED1203278.1 tautomerase family protein [Heyndrickxia acidicola]
MPFVHVYYSEDLSIKQEKLKKISLDIHYALMEHFNVPEKDYFQLFIPYPSHNMFVDPSYLLENGEERTENMLHIAITCGPGRTIEQKKSLYQALATSVSKRLNISAADVFITLNETPLENWSFGQGVAQMVKDKSRIGKD